MLIRRCGNCKEEYRYRETNEEGFTNGYCPECYYWIAHYNRYRRLYEKNPTNKNIMLMNICKKFIKAKQKEAERKEDFRIMSQRGGGYE